MGPTHPPAGPSIPLGVVWVLVSTGVAGLCAAFRAQEHPEVGVEPAESLSLAHIWH